MSDKPRRSPLRTLTSSPPPRKKPPRDTHALRKITSQAENRMRTRTAREQLANALAAGQGPADIPLPDADDSALRGVLR